jgi:hypothetical protein
MYASKGISADFGKSLKLHLAKQKKQRKLMYEEEKSV